ncbi:MAG: hypothetical protein WEC15_06145 [Flavobacteriales bacterium]
MFVRQLLPLLILSFCMAQGYVAQAQPPKTKVLLYKDRMAAEFDTVKVMKNVIKANPLLFFRGELPLYYERALAPNVSIEVGVGVTLRNYLALSLVGDDADDFGAGTEIIPSMSVRAGIRFYMEHDLEPQGWYIQPEFGQITYTKDIRISDPAGGFSEERLRDRRTFNDIRVLGGYQMLSYSSNWVFDVYGGFAFRVRDQLVVTETLDPSTRIFTYTQEQRNDRVPAFFLGLKVGMGF